MRQPLSLPSLSLKIVACALLGMSLCAASAFVSESFETRLSPAPLNDGTRAFITGEGHVDATLNGRQLTLLGDFHGLAANATTAEIHDGPGIGIMGPKAFDISVSPSVSGTITGTVMLSAKQAADLRDGHFYVQVNSQRASQGNLTGWLLPPHPFAGQDVPVAGPGFLPQFDVPRK